MSSSPGPTAITMTSWAHGEVHAMSLGLRVVLWLHAGSRMFRMSLATSADPSVVSRLGWSSYQTFADATLGLPWVTHRSGSFVQVIRVLLFRRCRSFLKLLLCHVHNGSRAVSKLIVYVSK